MSRLTGAEISSADWVSLVSLLLGLLDALFFFPLFFTALTLVVVPAFTLFLLLGLVAGVNILNM